MYYLLPWSLTVILYIPILIQLYIFRWQMIEYTHAYFILPISLWLVWRKRQVLVPSSSSQAQVTAFGLFLLGLGLVLYLFGWRQDYLFISTFSMIPVSSGLVLYFYGKRALKELLFPILYLLLLIPPPLEILDSITLPIRYGISFAADIILKLFDIPVVHNGLLLSLGGNDIYVGPLCNGLHSLITMLALALVYAYLIPCSIKTKVILVIAAIPYTLIGYLLHTVSIGLAVYYLGPKIAEGPMRFLSGLAIFIIMIACFIALEKRLKENEYD